MKSKIKIPNEILASIDFNNSLSGGSVEPIMIIVEKEESFEIDVKIPTVSPEMFKIDIIENQLWLYNMQAVLTNTKKNGFMPRTIGNIALPETVNREAISASYQNKEWKITLPKDNEKNSFRKHIDIKY
jgi:HSP20 family molecular chaperone IbpA